MIQDDKLSNVISTLQRLSSAIFSDAIQRKLILDNLTEGVFTVDPALKITSFNKSAQSITGISEDEALGKTCRDLFASTLREEFCIVGHVLEKGQPLLKLTRHLKVEDRLVPVLVSASPLVDNSGDIVGGVQSFQEITEIFHRQLILDSVFDGVLTVDMDFKITLFNRAAELITGFKQEQVLGKFFADVLRQEGANIAVDKMSLAKAINTGKPHVEECFYIETADHRVLPVSVRAAPLLDATGKIIGGVESFRDNTGAIQRQYILDSVGDGVFTVDHAFKITSFNKAAEIITGYRSEEVLGKRCRDVFDGSVCEGNCPLAKAMKSQSKVDVFDIIIHGKNAKEIAVSISATALVDEFGKIIGAVETFRDLTEIHSLRRYLAAEREQTGILSNSPLMQNILALLPEFARSDSNILIVGESGTGKELIARAIHKQSNRNMMLFVAVNSGALPEKLLEAELFGYRAGAFNDEQQDKKGYFATAEKGTLFLDEVGDISPTMQAKLLQVLQSKTYEPLGAETPVSTDARIIAATSKNLEELVEDNEFREDFYRQLNIVKIQVPPMRDRMEDLPLLSEHFIRKFNRQRGKEVEGLSEEALEILMRYDYPGNVRELENIIEYSFILCSKGLIFPQHLPTKFQRKSETDQALVNPETGEPMTLEEIEKHAIIAALTRNNFRTMQTCRELGISKDTLRRKIKAYGDIIQPII
ncbi:MAG: sigma 54-interacting transcriptional regulator [Proteobacteria bacterium]|nr:sigma 54-interacting transcriptional regulator [Pseudomonadota bacterium]MBU0966641.1 sigma 54-interacting transcriptional regulator [Pseudomonadota bacterium]